MFLLISVLIKNKQTKTFKIQGRKKKRHIAESQANPQAHLEANLIWNALLVSHSHSPSNENSVFQMQNVRHMAKHVLNKACYSTQAKALIHEQLNSATVKMRKPWIQTLGYRFPVSASLWKVKWIYYNSVYSEFNISIISSKKSNYITMLQAMTLLQSNKIIITMFLSLLKKKKKKKKTFQKELDSFRGKLLETFQCFLQKPLKVNANSPWCLLNTGKMLPISTSWKTHVQ